MTEIVFIRINGSNLLFSTNSQQIFSPIEGLHLNYNGVLKEHPDLKGNPNWKQEAIKRLKEHLKLLSTEDEISNYVINELKKMGYLPKYKQRSGHRIEVLH